MDLDLVIKSNGMVVEVVVVHHLDLDSTTFPPYAAPYAGGGRGGLGGPTEPLMYGVMNTGGGGGGMWNGNTGNVGGGGSGIVIVRYQIGTITAAAKATGGAVSY